MSDTHEQHVAAHTIALPMMPASTGRPNRWRRMLLWLGFPMRPGEAGYYHEQLMSAIQRHMDAHSGINSVMRGEKL